MTLDDKWRVLGSCRDRSTIDPGAIQEHALSWDNTQAVAASEVRLRRKAYGKTESSMQELNLVSLSDLSLWGITDQTQ